MAMRSISRAHMTACKAVARARATYNASIPSSGRHWTGCSHKKNAAYESPLATCTERSAFCAHLLPEDGASCAFKESPWKLILFTTHCDGTASVTSGSAPGTGENHSKPLKGPQLDLHRLPGTKNNYDDARGSLPREAHRYCQQAKGFHIQKGCAARTKPLKGKE